MIGFNPHLKLLIVKFVTTSSSDWSFDAIGVYAVISCGKKKSGFLATGYPRGTKNKGKIDYHLFEEKNKFKFIGLPSRIQEFIDGCKQ